MITVRCEQGSEEWQVCRNGIPTASCFDRIITPTGKLSAGRETYINELVAEWALGRPIADYKSYWMERGQEHESEAMDWYEFQMGATPDRIGFAYKDAEKMVGCSPDWLCEPDGGAEVKCPSPAIHVGFIRRSEIPKKYVPQVQGCLWVTGRSWWSFVSYHPDFKPLVVRIERDEKFQSLLDEHIPKFIGEMLDAREQIRD